MLAILAIGQSNIEGRYGPAQIVPAHGKSVTAWNWLTSQWGLAQLGVLPFKSTIGLSSPAHNAAYEMAHRYAAQACDDAAVVLLASGGKKIEYFLPNAVLNPNGWINNQSDANFGASLSEEIMGGSGSARHALNALDRSHFDVVVFDQGAGNFSSAPFESATEYAAKVSALIGELERRNFITASTPIVLSEINPFYPGAATHTAALNSLEGGRVAVVRWAGLEDVRSVCGVNNLHETGAGLAEKGRRYLGAFFRALVAS